MGTLHLTFTSSDNPEPAHGFEISTILRAISSHEHKLIESGYLVQRLSDGRLCPTKLWI